MADQAASGSGRWVVLGLVVVVAGLVAYDRWQPSNADGERGTISASDVLVPDGVANAGGSGEVDQPDEEAAENEATSGDPAARGRLAWVVLNVGACRLRLGKSGAASSRFQMSPHWGLSDTSVGGMSVDLGHASRRVQHGIIAFVIGLLITGLTYAAAEPGGGYVILWGLPAWGVYAIVSGWHRKQKLRRLTDEFAAGSRPRESVTQKAPPDWWSIRDVD